jgi:hypothetical protein
MDIRNNSNPTMQDTPGLRKTKKTEEVHDLSNASVRTTSISPEQEDNDKKINGTETE